MKLIIIINGLRYEHKFNYEINTHFTVEPWHENTSIQEGKLVKGEGMNSLQFALRPSSTLVI